MPVKKISIWIIVFIILIFILQNLDVIEVDFLFWSIKVSLLLVILLPFVLGVLLGWLLTTLYAKNRRQRKQAKEIPPNQM
jgi:putative membrane protein